MRAASDWNDEAGYVRFLSLQYSARKPVEDWLEDNISDGTAPPPQCPLIGRDLANLGRAVPSSGQRFTLSEPNPSHTLGAAWVLAGSALGNRSILKDLNRSKNSDWPREFLGDAAMLEHWTGLKKHIERPAPLSEIASATSAALAVFEHFLEHVRKTSVLNSDLRGPKPSCPMRLS